jgi:intracellular septation protein A
MLVIFFGKDYFSIYELGIFFIVLGVFWSFLQYKNISIKTLFQPMILIVVGIVSIIVEDILVLKSFPLILSFLFFIAFIYAQITKDFFLIRTIEKFKKIDDKERIYLEKTHGLWIIVTAINVLLHIYFLFYTSLEQWTFYVTVGWYILLGCGILFQILFRKVHEYKTTH